MKLKKEEVPQLVGQIIDIFEAFLEERAIDYCGYCPIDLRGEESELSASIEQVLDEWKLVRKHKED